MKVLLVTNMYPTPETPYYGIFVKEQMEAICKVHKDVFYTIFFIDGRNSKMEYLKSISKIHKLINKSEFDLIHVHYGLSGLFLLKKLKKNIPVVITLHGGDIQIEQGKRIQVFLTKLILKKTDWAITLNKKMDTIAKRYIPFTKIIPCSVNINTFTPVKKESVTNIKKIIFPSDRSREVKNYPLFENVIEILKSKYKIQCSTIEIKNMSRSEVSKLYGTSDLMIMTSISEGSPQVIKEAMACNLPIVSTNVGDVSNLLKGVRNSAVSESMDADMLAELAYQVLNNKIEGIYGRDKIKQMKLDDDSIGESLFNIYNRLIYPSQAIETN
ncbi:MAG: glycosyltransferase [Parabacteroides gordonii]|uniref:glycosyltransferase n=1 Tax=Parabacteroides gordonii TaxID=574930 RepID=UPI003A8A9BC8